MNVFFVKIQNPINACHIDQGFPFSHENIEPQKLIWSLSYEEMNVTCLY